MRWPDDCSRLARPGYVRLAAGIIAVSISNGGTVTVMNSASGAPRARPRIPTWVLLALSLLLLTQFLLGMVANLFVTVSTTHPGAGVANYVVGAVRSVGWAIAHRWPYLSLHELLGLSFMVGSVSGLVLALVARQPGRVVVWNVVNVLGIWMAAGSGMYFLIHPDADIASMLMATGFAVGLGALIVMIYLLAKARAAASV